MLTKLTTWSVTLAAVATLGLVGVTGEGPADEPEDALERMLVAMGSGAYDKACALVVADGTVLEGDALDACADAMRVYAEGVRPSSVRALREVDVPPLGSRDGVAVVRGTALEGVAPPFSHVTYRVIEVDDQWYVVAR